MSETLENQSSTARTIVMQNTPHLRLVHLIHTTIDSSPKICQMESDVETLKSDVSILKQDVAVLKQDVAVLKQDVALLKQEMHEMRLMLEDVQKKIEIILEALSASLRKSEFIDIHDRVIATQQDKIRIVEGAVKSHIANKSVHVSRPNKKKEPRKTSL
jgi:hypothetical protein